MVSRLFGFVRDMLLARILGAGVAGDAWQLAFQLPNIFRRLFAEGAFSAAFVPLFNRKLKHDDDGDRSEAQGFASDVLSVLLPVLIVFTAVLQIAMPGIIWFIDDFGRGGRTSDFSINLARLTFPYLTFISVMTVFAAILNSISRFAAAAAAPILLNLCLITALLASMWLDGGADSEAAAMRVAIGASLAGLLQMAWLWWAAHREGFRFRLHRPKVTPEIRELGSLIVPATMGAGIYYISRFLDLFFLGRLEEGSFVYLSMADRLNQLPLGIIGIALGVAILPALSRFIARGDNDGAQRIQSNSIELAMMLTIPAAVGLFFASEPLVKAFYFGGKFTAENVSNTAFVLSMLVIGLPAYVLVKVLTPGFFARKDTRSPVITAAFSLVLNVVLNIILVPRMGVAGLALASAIAAWTNCALLYVMLRRRGYYHLEGALMFRIVRICLSAAAMGLAVWWLMPYGSAWYGGGATQRALSILGLTLSGGFVFFSLAWLTGAIDRTKLAMLSRKSPVQE